MSVTVHLAVPVITWGRGEQTVGYTGSPAAIDPPNVELVNGETYSGDIAYSYTAGDSKMYTSGLPVDAGEYWVKASVPESGSYTAAQSGELKLTIEKAAPPAPAAPTAGEVTDNSITLTAVENAQYKMDNGDWQDSPESTGLAPNHAYTFYIRLKADKNHQESLVSPAASITTKKPSLSGAEVAVSRAYTYRGAVIVPPPEDVAVKLGGTTLDPGQYTLSARENLNAGDGMVTVTAAESGNYSDSAEGRFTITPAELTITAKPQAVTYGQSIVQNSGGQDVTANYKITYRSGALTIHKNASAVAPAVGEGYELDYIRETIAVKPGYEVRTAETDGAAVDGSISAHLGQTLYIRKVEDSNHAASGWTAFELAARPSQPSLTKTDEALKGQKNGSVSGVSAGMEYSTDSGAAWRPCSGTEITGLGACTVLVRIKAAEAVPHGEAASCPILEGKPITVAFDSKGAALSESKPASATVQKR